jgi:hypothetical protein
MSIKLTVHAEDPEVERLLNELIYLSKILGHTSVKTTERYLQSLGVEDLQAVHNGLSLLSPK